jgi:hypothetical protein
MIHAMFLIVFMPTGGLSGKRETIPGVPQVYRDAVAG